MARNYITPRIYTDVPRKNGEGTVYATFQARYYGNEKERVQAEESIKTYYASLFKEQVKFTDFETGLPKIIKCFCMFDSATDECTYKKNTIEIVKAMIGANLRNKEIQHGDSALVKRIDLVLQTLDTYKNTLNPHDYALLIQRFEYHKLPLYRSFTDKYLPNTTTPLI